MSTMLEAALGYNQEGLCVIPVKPRGKRPALASWERYQTKRSTMEEIRHWFNSGSSYNVGIVHGVVSGNYVTLDIDHDAGLLDLLRTEFPVLFSGRLEQSGSGDGFHIPLRPEVLPDFGTNERQKRPRGNRTWKTEQGTLNIRARFCQTVAPPSIHPSGRPYVFIQHGEIVQLPDLSPLLVWLDELTPPPNRAPRRSPPPIISPVMGKGLVEAVRNAWPTALIVFKHFGLAGNLKTEMNGELRLKGNGGLLIAADDPTTWFCFSDEVGGGVIEAWGWCRFGSAFDKRRQFRQVLLEMAQAADIDTAQFYRKGDENKTKIGEGDQNYWKSRYSSAWGRMR